MELSEEGFTAKVSGLFSQMVSAYANNVKEVAEAGFLPRLSVDVEGGELRVKVFETSEEIEEYEAECISLATLGERVKLLEKGLSDVLSLEPSRVVESVKSLLTDVAEIKSKLESR